MSEPDQQPEPPRASIGPCDGPLSLQQTSLHSSALPSPFSRLSDLLSITKIPPADGATLSLDSASRCDAAGTWTIGERQRSPGCPEDRRQERTVNRSCVRNGVQPRARNALIWPDGCESLSARIRDEALAQGRRTLALATLHVCRSAGLPLV